MGVVDAEVTNKIWHSEQEEKQQSTQSYKEAQGTQGSQDESTTKDPSNQPDQEEPAFVPFRECSCEVPHLFGRVYGEFGAWLDKEGQVLFDINHDRV